MSDVPFSGPAITVAAGAVFAPNPGNGSITAGTTGAGSAGATLSLANGSTFDMADGGVGTFNLQEQTSFAGPAVTLNGATLDLDLGQSGVDQLVAGKGVSRSGANTINITVVGSSLTLGTYNLISAQAGTISGSGTFRFNNNSLTENVIVGGQPYQLILGSSGAVETVSVAPGSVWVDDNWVDQTNPNATTPAVGDTVTAPAGETAPNLNSGTLTFGDNAFSTITDGVAGVVGGGTVYVLPGTYVESDISLDQPVSVVGPTTGTATVVPAVADGHEEDRDDWFGSGTHNAFVIRASDVALQNLTIDGGSGFGYFCGVETDWTTSETYNDLSVTGLTVRNVFCLGIDVESGADPGTGDLIYGNTVENVVGAAIVRGICLLDATGVMSNNEVSNVVAASDTPYSEAAVGIYLDTFDIPGVTATIDNNTVSGTPIGINVMGMDNPSNVSGNTVTMPSGDNVFGIVVRDVETVGWSPEPVADDGVAMTVANNQL